MLNNIVYGFLARDAIAPTITPASAGPAGQVSVAFIAIVAVLAAIVVAAVILLIVISRKNKRK